MKILKSKINGIYNVSLGQKVFISEILHELNKRKINNKFNKINDNNEDSFYLNNKKLLKKIKIKISKKDLLDYCYRM